MDRHKRKVKPLEQELDPPPKKVGMIVVRNEKNEFIPTRIVTCGEYVWIIKNWTMVSLKITTPFPSLIKCVTNLGQEYHCLLDGYSSYNHILIAPEDQ